MFEKIKKTFREVFVNSFASSPITPVRLRLLIYRLFGIKVGASSIQPGCMIVGDNIEIGDGVLLNNSSILHNPRSKLSIGDNTWIAMNVVICTTTHEIGPPHQRAGEILSKPVSIGQGCWIGASATILPGVTIGDGCIIAAGAVVTKDCEPNGLYAGVPAKKIKDLP